MTHIVSVAGQKGGTGKTTTAMALAAVAGETLNVLLVDVDPQESASWWARRVGETCNFHYMVDTDPDHLGQLDRLGYDLVIVDTPGSLEGHDVLQAVVRASDFVLLPTLTAALSMVPMARTVSQIVKPAGIPYSVVLNAVDPRSPKELADARKFLEQADVDHFEWGIRSYKWHRQAALAGTLVTQPLESDRFARSAIGDVRRVTAELMARLEG